MVQLRDNVASVAALGPARLAAAELASARLVLMVVSAMLGA